MKLIYRGLITAIIVFTLSHFLSGIQVDGFIAALGVAVVLAILNLFVKPILVLLTFPVTVLTLGLFLLVINAFVILICDEIVDGFHVNSFLTAVVFSVILSISQSILYKIFDKK